MQTNFTDMQRTQVQVRDAESILRSCVHCGFCTATCPTYLQLGDELDGPRGRIYLIKDMLESDCAPAASVVRHIDRCLSCLGCMTTCPSGVNYMHLVDHARVFIEDRHARPLTDRFMRLLLAKILPRPSRFRIAVLFASMVRPFRQLLPGRLRAMVEVAPRHVSPASDRQSTGVSKANGPRRLRVGMVLGCVQQVSGAHIDRAAERLLQRLGCEVVRLAGSECCGALTHHLGKSTETLDLIRNNVAAWSQEREKSGLDAIAMTASGCGTVVKDYGYLMQNEDQWATAASELSGIVKDVSEVIDMLGLPEKVSGSGIRVAYEDACSLVHGQKIRVAPRELLRDAGFDVVEVPDGHLCCGSAGTYSVLQPVLANVLGAQKAENIESVAPEVVAVGNIGCINQISTRTDIPVVHTVELLDWATGGPRPQGLGQV